MNLYALVLYIDSKMLKITNGIPGIMIDTEYLKTKRHDPYPQGVCSLVWEWTEEQSETYSAVWWVLYVSGTVRRTRRTHERESAPFPAQLTRSYHRGWSIQFRPKESEKVEMSLSWEVDKDFMQDMEFDIKVKWAMVDSSRQNKNRLG